MAHRGGPRRRRASRAPDASVHCAITSPPYFGLRDYHLAPQVWGSAPDCEHAWEEHHVYTDSPSRTGKERLGFHDAGVTRKQRWHTYDRCCACGAWRGSLGAEPTPSLYVGHLVEVFREVRRVLRPDGTCWLVIGDSHAGSWGDYVAPGSTKHGSKQATSRWQRPGYEQAKHHTRPPTANHTSFGLKKKDLIGIPWRVAFALQADGWWLRSDIVWWKPNPMPESVKDRPTRCHEYVFLLSKSARYFYDSDAIREPHKPDSHNRDPNANPGRQAFVGVKAKEYAKNGGKPHRVMAMRGWAKGGRNKRTVWQVAARPYRGAHYATYPVELVTPCVLAGAPEGGVVLDPFAGSGSTIIAALRHGRRAIGIDLNDEYVAQASDRVVQDAPLLNRQEATA